MYTLYRAEDVSGDSPIIENPNIRQAISASPFCEDFSGETLMLSMLGLNI
jgi:hypothetical protein